MSIDKVVAKMTCNTLSTTRYQFGEQVKVDLGAVYSTSGENKDFCDATPSGACWMNIAPGYPAGEFFKPGKKYFVTFTEAPD